MSLFYLRKSLGLLHWSVIVFFINIIFFSQLFAADDDTDLKLTVGITYPSIETVKTSLSPITPLEDLRKEIASRIHSKISAEFMCNIRETLSRKDRESGTIPDDVLFKFPRSVIAEDDITLFVHSATQKGPAKKIKWVVVIESNDFRLRIRDEGLFFQDATSLNNQEEPLNIIGGSYKTLGEILTSSYEEVREYNMPHKPPVNPGYEDELSEDQFEKARNILETHGSDESRKRS